jgi:hypothetical protein
VLNRAYWIGVNRTAAPNLYAYCDGSYVPQLVGEEPYAHWSWFHVRAKANSENNCARASPDVAFEFFTGSTSVQMANESFYVVTGLNRRYGWTGVNCVSQLPYVCEVPAATYSCPEPMMLESPAAWPPLSPPEPPQASWSGCKPTSSATLYCSSSGTCYAYRTPGLIFPKAQEACRRLGGELVRYSSLAEQYAVERYFADAQVLTPLYYWIGVSRTSNSSRFSYTANRAAFLPQVPSNDPYYAHWTWVHPVQQEYDNHDCVLAYASYSYSQYVGDGSSASSRDASNYQAGSLYRQRPYGWAAYLCNANPYDYICEVDASKWTCPPRPSPPGPPRPKPRPPLPSPPPSPPLPCEEFCAVCSVHC